MPPSYSAPSVSAVKSEFLSVSELVEKLNILFELELGVVRFEGEISQVQRAQSGHLYYSVKDASAQISCVMWASAARSLAFKPDVGMMVQCFGRGNVYPPTGRFQFVVQKMVPSGEGLLQRRFLELKERLQKEGFFSTDRKRALPRFPKAVGIVTSRTGAVIHDMMVKIRERFPAMPVYLADCRVQGEGAAEEIACSIQRLDASRLVDVIIVARGGGSLEDLWAFNEERVVKAVFACKVPTVSGVGHEVDITLCDLAADIRAPTPTAAAEMVVPKRQDLLLELAHLERRLKNYERHVQVFSQRVDELSSRLTRSVKSVFEQAMLRLTTAQARIELLQPSALIRFFSSRLDHMDSRLRRGMQGVIKSNVSNYQRVEARLTALDPLSILQRGFALVEKDGRIIKSSDEVEVSETVEIRLAKGRITSQVIKRS